MNQHLRRNNTVRVCKKDLCIETQGKNADLIVGASVLSIVLMGIGAFIAATR